MRWGNGGGVMHNYNPINYARNPADYILWTICGRCEYEWRTDSGRTVCRECGNDGTIEGHVIREGGRVPKV